MALPLISNLQIVPMGLYRLPDFLPHAGLSRSTWYFYVDTNRAPKPAVQIPNRTGRTDRANRSLWRGADILEWLADPVAWESNHAAGAAVDVGDADMSSVDENSLQQVLKVVAAPKEASHE